MTTVRHLMIPIAGLVLAVPFPAFTSGCAGARASRPDGEPQPPRAITTQAERQERLPRGADVGAWKVVADAPISPPPDGIAPS